MRGLPFSSLSPGLIPALALGASLLGGCANGPSCQTACQKLFQSDQCNITHPGESQQEQQNDCLLACADALDNPGPQGNYEPTERATGSESVTLETDQQAAAWMECVEATSCEYLSDGYCAPVSF